MIAILDSAFIYATLDKKDINHKATIETLSVIEDSLILPDSVLVEISYLLQARLGHQVMRYFIKSLDNSPILFEAITMTDVSRIYELLDRYADARLGFVDASIVAIAERLNINRVLTVDQRDFHLIQPLHCDYFEVLP